MRIKEAKLPSSVSTGGEPWYHGCDNEAAFLGIASAHTIVAIPHPFPRAMQAPIKGRVYLTPSIEYACINALGGVMMGHNASDGMLRKGRYGYVFLVNESELTDVLPDEDVVGYEICRVWNLYNKSYPTDERDSRILEIARMVLTDKEKIEIRRGNWTAMQESRIGKRAISNLHASHLMLFLKKGASVSQSLSVCPYECWRIEKARCIELDSNASNFFDIASLAWTASF